jgi:putative peptidoglycan lipid II flippase
VSTALLIYSVQLPFTALDQLFIAAFYAIKNTVTPALIGVAGGVVYLAVALSLVQPMGVFGLVTANTVQNSFHGVVLGLLLWRRMRGFGPAGARLFLAKLAIAGGVAAVAAVAVRELAIRGLEPGAEAGWATLIAGVATVVVAYGLSLAILRMREVTQLWLFARRSIRGSPGTGRS